MEFIIVAVVGTAIFAAFVLWRKKKSGTTKGSFPTSKKSPFGRYAPPHARIPDDVKKGDGKDLS